jgi:hypothetical protein
LTLSIPVPLSLPLSLPRKIAFLSPEKTLNPSAFRQSPPARTPAIKHLTAPTELYNHAHHHINPHYPSSQICLKQQHGRYMRKSNLLSGYFPYGNLGKCGKATWTFHFASGKRRTFPCETLVSSPKMSRFFVVRHKMGVCIRSSLLCSFFPSRTRVLRDVFCNTTIHPFILFWRKANE